jgi:hypothetical protein
MKLADAVRFGTIGVACLPNLSTLFRSKTAHRNAKQTPSSARFVPYRQHKLLWPELIRPFLCSHRARSRVVQGGKLGAPKMAHSNIDRKHNEAIRQEIAERLRGFLRERPVSPRLRKLVSQFGEQHSQDICTQLDRRIARLREGLVKRR